MDNELENYYILAEHSYVKKMKEKDKLNFDEKQLFPYNWYKIEDYKLKLEILAEALKKGILIEETDKFNNMINTR